MGKRSTVSDRITRAEAHQALLRSGYLLESRIEAILDSIGYYVEANVTYPDPITGRQRELDLYAISARQLGRGMDFVLLCLLIECVNNPQPLVFITKEPQVRFLYHNDFKLSGLPVKILEEGEEDSWEMLSDYLNMGQYHHYCKGRVATQFCSFRKKKSSTEWMALHEEEHFDCFRKLSDVVAYRISEHFRNWDFNDEEEPVNLQLYYPVVVVQGELYDARPSQRSVRLTRSQHIQFRRSSIIQGEEENFQFDVIAESHFPKYVELIKEEREKIARRLVRRMPHVRRSIRGIVDKARKETDAKKRRDAMDF